MRVNRSRRWPQSVASTQLEELVRCACGPGICPRGNVKMAVTVTRTSTLFTDLDGDGSCRSRRVILSWIRITDPEHECHGHRQSRSTTPRAGVTLVPGTVKVTPIAYRRRLATSPATPLYHQRRPGPARQRRRSRRRRRQYRTHRHQRRHQRHPGHGRLQRRRQLTFTPRPASGRTSFKYFVRTRRASATSPRASST